MSKRKPSSAPAVSAPPETPWFSFAAFRETVESFAIALILAFLVRTFEAEAFVIPTGSMAPTLMGRHKDVICPECGYTYQVGASEEINNDTNESTNIQVTGGTCPMCRYEADIETLPSYNGDRILVGKFFYQFWEPKRWDVVVFKYPGRAEVNYIKRLVGLPGETLWLQDGDVFLRKAGEKKFHIARKSDTPQKLLKMLQPVYDNDYVDPRLVALGCPLRWQPAPGGAAGAWHSSADYRVLSCDGSSAEPSWIRYRHYLPMPENWERLRRKQLAGPVEPQYIQDFYAYNSTVPRPPSSPGAPNWVGDLALECTLRVAGDQGQVIFELVRAGLHFTCTIDVTSGEARFAEDQKLLGKFGTSIRGRGDYRLMFSNIDDELLLWRDRQIIGRQVYDRPPSLARPSDADYTPAGMAAQGVALQAEHVRLFRDIFYVPQRFVGNQDVPPAMFDIPDDHFMMLGDNSPCSADSRYWGFVNRDLLVGKALFVYWPHSWDHVHVLWWNIPFPFFPNFHRMEPVH